MSEELQAVPSWAVTVLQGLLAVLPYLAPYLGPQLTALIIDVIKWVLASKNPKEAFEAFEAHTKKLIDLPHVASA